MESEPPNRPVVTAALGILAALIIAAALFAALGRAAAASEVGQLAAAGAEFPDQLQTTPVPSPSPTPTLPASLFMPLIRVVKTPEVELLKAWSSDPTGGKLQAYLPGAPLVYRSSGLNNLGIPGQVSLRWQQSGVCASGQVFSSTVTLPAGAWEHGVPSMAPICSGVFSATADLAYKDLNLSRITDYVVNQPGSIQISLQQGFDRCYKPSLADMQAWWDHSPYVVFNLYIGGISFACKDDAVDAVWVRQAAEQGWSFILTWVGPQAPCTSFKYRMSYDPDEAYLEGKAEAQAAFSAATGLGFFGQKIIYYDIEGYPDNTSCRKAVKAFVRGWSEKLHSLEQKAGAYGSPCKSYISDWATVDPPPDDVWIAHWYRTSYDEDADVWDPPTPCLDNGLWVNHQRLKQYTGGHKETWGGEQLTIDSNVLEGEINLLEALGESAARLPQVTLETHARRILDAGLLDTQRGWVLVENEGADTDLLLTPDGGASWEDVTPAIFEGGSILAVSFVDSSWGLAVGAPADGSGLWAARTSDGGHTWDASSLPVGESGSSTAAGAAYIETLDRQQAWVALRLHSGSSFSLGRLFASVNGGASWEERSLPIGEAVRFTDESNGWTAGGAAGDELYRTRDGGASWAAIAVELPEGYRGEMNLPSFDSPQRGRLTVLLYGERGQRLANYVTQDGGSTWVLESQVALASGASAAALLQAETGLRVHALPGGVLNVELSSGGYGWAVVQEGTCLGDKSADGEAVRCTQVWKLMATRDGGLMWEEITP